jgi:ATP-dependent Clp protease ATP-binding subunit ClpA
VLEKTAVVEGLAQRIGRGKKDLENGKQILEILLMQGYLL